MVAGCPRVKKHAPSRPSGHHPTATPRTQFTPTPELGQGDRQHTSRQNANVGRS